MAKDPKQNITIDLKKLNSKLCPKCREVLKRVVSDKLAEAALD